MIIDCISDLHGRYPELEGGDLLIVAGDFTARDTAPEHERFCHWVSRQNYCKKIIVAGNHDNVWVNQIPHKGPDPINPNYEWYEYLCDSVTEFEGLKIWGSPWTLRFPGMNPKCMAFTVDTEDELAEKWAMIPEDVDILVTHSPPYGILDLTQRNQYVGSVSLRNYALSINQKAHIFGHIHEQGGKMVDTVICKFINASHVNERYEPLNKPVRIVL